MKPLLARTPESARGLWIKIGLSVVVFVGLISVAYWKLRARKVDQPVVQAKVEPPKPAPPPPAPEIKAPAPEDPVIAEFKKIEKPYNADEFIKKRLEDAQKSPLKPNQKAADMERVIELCRLMQEKWPTASSTPNTWRYPSYAYDLTEDFDRARMAWVEYAKKVEKLLHERALKNGKSEKEAAQFAYDQAAGTFSVRASDWMGKAPLRANEYYQEIITRYPKSGVHYDTARLYSGNNLRYIDKAKALPFYQEVAHDPNAMERYVRQAYDGILDIQTVNNTWADVEKTIVEFETRFTSEEDQGYAQYCRAHSLESQGFKTYPQARDAYRLFIAKYPQHPIIPRAKEELVMMDKMEELNRQNQAKNKAEKPVEPPKE